MSKNRRAMAPILAVLIGLVGALAFLVGPAAADEHVMSPTASGDALADDTSVASGSAIAKNGSTASGEAVAIDGSVGSGCSTAIDDSTASGASNCPSEHKAHKAKPATPVSSKLALTGSSTDGFATVALTALFAGALLVAVATSRRRHVTS